MLSKENDSWFTDEHRHEVMEKVSEVTVSAHLRLDCSCKLRQPRLPWQLTKLFHAQVGLDERQSHAFCVSVQLSKLMAADALALLSSVSFSAGQHDGDPAEARVII